MATTTYTAQIIQQLSKLGHIAPPDKSNSGKMLAIAYMWDEVAAYAKRQSEAQWNAVEKEGLFKEPKDPGEYELISTSRFLLKCNVSQPVKRFDAQAMAVALNKGKYRVPLHETLSAIESAKTPGNPKRTYKIIERAE